MREKDIIFRKLKELLKDDPVRFHMPGHKGKYYYDITEIPEADNLQSPEGILRETEEKIAEIYGAAHSFMLTGGSTLGLESAILDSCNRGDKILIPENAHRSVISAVLLGGLKPVIYSLKRGEIGCAVDLDILSDKIKENPDLKAVVIVSPDYFGNISDLKAVRELTADKILIVDQAHGAHLKFLPGESDAIGAGADYVVESTHKLLGAPTQGAILHTGKRVNEHSFRKTLGLLQTSSPSYPLLIGIERAVDEAEEKAGSVFGRIYDYYDYALKNYKSKNIVLVKPGARYDKSKFIFKTADAGGLAEKLIREFRIIPELITSNYLLMMTGIGTGVSDLERLFKVLNQLSVTEEPPGDVNEHPPAFNYEVGYEELRKRPVKLTPLKESEGRISAGYVIPFPPCIPVLIPGSRIKNEHLKFLERANLRDIQGLIVKNNNIYIETL